MKTIYYLLLILIYSSCQKELSIPLPEHQQKLTCNSLFTKDSIFLYLTQSQLIYDKLNHTNISDASILFKSGNELLTHIDFSSEGYYKSGIKLSENTNYTLEITTNGYNLVFSNDYLPELVKIDSLIFFPKVGMDEEGDEYSEVIIYFTDPIYIKNYYEISVYYLFSDPYSGRLAYRQGGINSNDLVVMNEGDDDFFYSNIVLSDDFFNGEKYQLKCNISYNENHPVYYLHLRSISENYYKYKKSLMRHFANQEGDVWSGSGNPVELYSNIEGGYGIFAGYQEDVDTIYANK
ncbi:MAG: DUF4249 domain-containing protein [Bacteroidales bacterium]